MTYGREEDKTREQESYAKTSRGEQVTQAVESHIVYELRQQREYYFRKLMDIQVAIDAINKITY